MAERFRQLIPGTRSEIDSAIGGQMIARVLNAKRQVKEETPFVAGIETLLFLQEIQFVSRFLIEPPEEPIDIRLVRLKGAKDKGIAIFLILNPDWLEEAWLSEGPAQEEYLYGKLKLIQITISSLKKNGEEVLNKTRTKLILQRE